MSDLPPAWDMEHALYLRACEGVDWDYTETFEDPYERNTMTTESVRETDLRLAGLTTGDAFDVARSLRFKASTLRKEADSLDSTASYLEHSYLNDERSDA